MGTMLNQQLIQNQLNQEYFQGETSYNSDPRVGPAFFFDKRVVITGAGSGIGKALSYYFLNQGAHVFMVINDHSTEQIQSNKVRKSDVDRMVEEHFVGFASSYKIDLANSEDVQVSYLIYSFVLGVNYYGY